MKANDINKIEDFGQKICGARKDYYTEAREAAAQYLTVADLVHNWLPSLRHRLLIIACAKY